jgi:glycosyltransferase involved in cell wall biosynthesis
MSFRTDTAAVIPCLNEAASIPWLVAAVQHHVNAVCVVDDGSTDGTAEAAQRAGAHLIRHATPQGKGAALRGAWRWAEARGFAWALTLDGDGQHSPADIPCLFQAAERTGAALVAGNRMEQTAKMPWVRRLVNRWMSRRLSLLTGCDLPDSQCGFRLLSLHALRNLPLHAEHFEIESEVLVAFMRAGLRVEFTPVSVIYRSERSKIRPLRDTLRWFRWWRTARRSAPAPVLAPVSQRIRPQTAS